MATNLITRSAVILATLGAIAAAIPAHADPVGITADQVAQCEYEARLYAEQTVRMTGRIKVPLSAGLALAFGAGPVGVLLAATIAANAESPIERRAIIRYRNDCLGLSG
jgi:hypothetical protein